MLSSKFKVRNTLFICKRNNLKRWFYYNISVVFIISKFNRYWKSLFIHKHTSKLLKPIVLENSLKAPCSLAGCGIYTSPSIHLNVYIILTVEAKKNIFIRLEYSMENRKSSTLKKHFSFIKTSSTDLFNSSIFQLLYWNLSYKS